MFSLRYHEISQLVPWFHIISALKAQAAEWARMPSPGTKAWHYARTLSHWVLNTVHTHVCACSW